ncbi:MAG TPA: 23S rRNA (pseudouridine(1915)-N(3))-methyltransferase RlmH [Alphaproteobacteria bacterium]|nr:23S rRNA (pseudouridine(1915)-N(3))-methyltransferase RlmH [Alphaproteobacteria bacterium]
MQFNIICIGKCKDKNINAIYDDYAKRFKPFSAKINLVELNHGKGSADEIKSQEKESILAKVPNSSFLIALDERGKQYKTSKFANLIAQKSLEGFSNYTLVIGGAEGLHPEIREKANLVLALSEMTLPHMLVRPILAEQLYRIITFNSGHPYHREG